MNIAIAANGDNLDSKVSEQFEKCLYLLIINTDDLNIKAIKNDELNLSSEILKNNCEALITDKIGVKEFDVLADEYVTRYNGSGSSVRDSIKLMDKNLLNIIKTCDGSNDCSGHHH